MIGISLLFRLTPRKPWASLPLSDCFLALRVSIDLMRVSNSGGTFILKLARAAHFRSPKFRPEVRAVPASYHKNPIPC